jgi:hypothetical protein
MVRPVKVAVKRLLGDIIDAMRGGDHHYTGMRGVSYRPASFSHVLSRLPQFRHPLLRTGVRWGFTGETTRGR